MAVYARDLAAVELSIFQIRIEGAGTDGLISISPPKFIEHVDGQTGDAVHYKTGMKTATAQLTVLQSADVNVDLLGVINEAKADTDTNGQGAFFCKDRNTGQTMQGDCTIDGYPDQIQQSAEENNYVYNLRIYNFEITA